MNIWTFLHEPKAMNADGAQLDSQIRTIDRYSGPNQLPDIHTTLLFFTVVTTQQRNLIKIVSLSLNLLRPSSIGICKIRWTTTWICLSKRRRFTIGLFWALSCRNPGGDRSLIGFKDGSATTLVASCFTLFLVFFGASTSITSSATFIYLKVTQLSF